jgi:hypothetical protein
LGSSLGWLSIRCPLLEVGCDAIYPSLSWRLSSTRICLWYYFWEPGLILWACSKNQPTLALCSVPKLFLIVGSRGSIMLSHSTEKDLPRLGFHDTTPLMTCKTPQPPHAKLNREQVMSDLFLVFYSQLECTIFSIKFSYKFINFIY